MLKADFIAEMLRCQRNQIPFCVSRVTKFEWERVYMIYGQNDGWREEQVSGQICGNGFAIGPHKKYIFFLKGKELINYFLLSQDDVNFYMNSAVRTPIEDCPNNYGTPETACYKILKEHDKILNMTRLNLISISR